MRYFKVYHQNVRRRKPHQELTHEGFCIEVGYRAAENALAAFDENSNIDFDAEEKTDAKEVERIVEEAKSDHGFNAGDYNLYIRDNDFDMYDIPRE